MIPVGIINFLLVLGTFLIAIMSGSIGSTIQNVKNEKSISPASDIWMAMFLVMISITILILGITYLPEAYHTSKMQQTEKVHYQNNVFQPDSSAIFYRVKDEWIKGETYKMNK